MNIVENPITSLTKANYVGILAWAVVIGIACRHAKESTKDMLVDISNGLSKVVTWIINFAPFGIMGLVFDTVSNNGMSVFKEYGKLLMLLVGTMLFIYFVTNPILVFWCTHKTLAAANTLGITVDIPSAILLSILAALSACGASGVAGGSLLLIPMACSLFGIPNDVAMQVVGIGFIIGVIQDSVETALNSSSDLLLSASAEFRQWRKEGREITY